MKIDFEAPELKVIQFETRDILADSTQRDIETEANQMPVEP